MSVRSTITVLCLTAAALGMAATSTLAAGEAQLLGARPIAMGGAFVAESGDANSPYMNPSGLAGLESSAVTSMYSRMFGEGGPALGYISGGLRLGDRAGIGLALMTNQASLSEESPSGAVSTVTMGESSLTVAAGFAPTSRLSLGLGASVVSLSAPATATTNWLGLDAGMQWKASDLLTLGASCKNLLSTRVGDEDLPRSCHVGALARLAETFDITFDVEYKENPMDDVGLQPIICVGSEYRVSEEVTLRGGYRDGKPSIGLGLTKGPIVVDYTYDNGELGGSHRISLGFAF